ncbi:MAG: hypothetical protein KDE27_05690 [Planctomycetes bacterium]|nr:hypothetical protein [Planctomycetota bacterium]
MTESNPTPRNPELTLKRFVLRSLLPIMAVVLLALTPLIGPYGFAAAVAGWWYLQTKV